MLNYEYWNNGVNADNSWTFIKGPSSTPGTGPAAAAHSTTTYAFCDVKPAMVGQTFAMASPLVDFLDVQPGASPLLHFSYHMHGLHIGSLKVQASHDRTFQSGVKDLLVQWNYRGGGPVAYELVGQQHANGTDAFKTAKVEIDEFIQTRFYIRFLYVAGATQMSECAIDDVQIYISSGDINRENSFKLFDPTYDNHHRPSAIRTRSEFAKRPLNIRNIHMTGSSPTKAGNFLNRYEYLNTTSPEANDPFFVKNAEQIAVTSSERVVMAKIEDILKQTPGTPRTGLPATSGHSGSLYVDYTLPDRSYITGSSTSTPAGVRNRTRIMTRFSTPGFEATSRGVLDPAHETYSAYNATTFKNLSARRVRNTQLQSHCGKFGVSAHTEAVAGRAQIVVLSTTLSYFDETQFTIFDGVNPAVTFEGEKDGLAYNSYVINSLTRTVTYGVAGAGSAQNIRDSIKGAIEQAITRGWLSLTVSTTNPDTGGSSSNSIYILYKHPGAHANNSIKYEAKLGSGKTSVSKSALNLLSGYRTLGVDSTARVFGSEATGRIISSDYSLSGQAAAHKYHRNNIERIEFVGDITDGNLTTYITASSHDNAYVSHTIPRTDKQYAWITGSLI